jgi:hypothetical protein
MEKNFSFFVPDAFIFKMNSQTMHFKPWRRGIVVIASAYRTEDPGFESRQGVRFFRNLYIAVLLS